MNGWQHIYEQFDPVAFNLFAISVHWYGIMYVLALLSALYAAKWIVKKDAIAITDDQLDAYFLYVEIGVILGARLGYIIFYDPNVFYYLTHPWQIFNPFNQAGDFVGISGMSYHGAVIGFFIGAFLYYRKSGVHFGRLLDVSVIAIAIGYVFGRIGNFLNQELVGRATDASWGIYVDGVLRHPSQLYEAVLEGLAVFALLYAYRNYKRFEGELVLLYGIGYGVARFVAEFWREPDPQLGFICCGWMSMGQLLSSLMIVGSIVLWGYLMKKGAAKSL
jgi:phosphatidylglycerol:prolipoprotein diacylglycerol transferase